MIEYSYSFQSWEIFKLDPVSCRKYFQSLIGEENLQDYGENVQGPTPTMPNLIYTAYSRRILSHFVRTKKKWYFTDPKDNILYPVVSWTITLLCGNLTILFNCGHFIACQDSVYADFYFILYPNDKKVLQISQSSVANLERILSAYLNPQLEWSLSSTNLNLEPRIYLFLGFSHNLGHTLWNELSGLYYTLISDAFIHNKHLFQRIVIGPYDFFDYTSIVRRMIGDHGIPIIKIQHIYELSPVLHSEINDQRTILPLYVGCYRIPLDIKSVLGFDCIQHLPLLPNRNDVIMTIGIRTNNKCLLDTVEFYTTIIQTVDEWLKTYNKTLTIKITGEFTSFCVSESGIPEIGAQSDIFQQIQKRLPNIEIESFIGFPLEEILKKVGYSDIMIAPIGTSVPNLANWIFRSDLIWLSSPQNLHWVPVIQFEANNNYNLTAISDSHIIQCESSSTYANFQVEIPIVIETIKKYLVSKM
jgi:hypothetical protein